jgi:hypothetical protein
VSSTSAASRIASSIPGPISSLTIALPAAAAAAAAAGGAGAAGAVGLR